MISGKFTTVSGNISVFSGHLRCFSVRIRVTASVRRGARVMGGICPEVFGIYSRKTGIFECRPITAAAGGWVWRRPNADI